MTTTNKTHYVYKITNLHPINSQQFYIGVHSDKNPDSLHDGYMGSSKYLDIAMLEQGIRNFKKEILSKWSTRKEAMLEEIRIHEELDIAKNQNYYNKSKSHGTRFDISGFVSMLDVNDNRILLSVSEAKDEKYHSIHSDKVSVEVKETGEKIRVSKSEYSSNKHLYNHSVTNTVTAVNKLTGITKQVSKEEFDNNDNLHGVQEGRVNIMDITTGKRFSVSKIEYENNACYITASHGRITVRDIRDNKFKQVTKEDYKKYDYYKHHASKIIAIYDLDNIEQFRAYGGFKKMCRDNKLPFNAFATSCQNAGEPIYKIVGSNMWKLKKSGYIQYQGWYAKEI